jgi:hypothetical protein
MPSRTSRAAKKVAPAAPHAREVPLHCPLAAPGAVDVALVVTAYTWGGAVVDPGDPSAVAKTSYDPGTRQTRYWLKRATTGRDRGFLFNPHSPAFDRDRARGVVAHTGRGEYEYRPATQQAFELYLKFLSPPHNPVDLRAAERMS